MPNFTGARKKAKLSAATTLNLHNATTSQVKPRKIRLLLIITGLATGGATNVVLDIASYFSKHPDYEVELLAGAIPLGRNDVTHLAHERGITLRQIPSLVNYISPLHNLRAVIEIRTIMAKGGYDIVHTHSSVAGIVGRMAARLAGVPTVIHHVHGWGLSEGMSRATRTLYLMLERLCAKFTDRIVVVTKQDIQKGLLHKIGNSDKYAVIYNGIPVKDFQQTTDEKQLRQELGLHPTHKLVGMVGRLDRQKNPLDFIRAASEVVQSYSNVQFLMVGDGLLRPECEQLIKESGLDKKFFLLGFRNDVPEIMSILTITAMSSLWEGLPLTFLESMSAGKPIVANDVDGACDVIVNGETGFLVPPHQPSQMSKQIVTLLKDETLCQKMGNTARERSTFFSVQRMVEQLDQLYKELQCNVLHST